MITSLGQYDLTFYIAVQCQLEKCVFYHGKLDQTRSFLFSVLKYKIQMAHFGFLLKGRG